MGAARRALLSTLVMTTRPVIGGQAVMEGVMMRSPKSLAVAVRQPDGSIALREEQWLSFSERLPFLKWPILRGANMLVESLYNGMLALNWSAATAYPDDKDAQAQQERGQKGLWLTVVVSMAFAFLIFKGVPHLSTFGLGTLLGRLFGGDNALPMDGALFHLVDGAIKVAVFAGYIALIARMNEVKRLFMYHGAEHKSVHVWEAEEPLDVDHARPKTTAHPRCGTSLILLVIATSILVFAAVLPFVPRVFASDFAQAVFLLAVKLPLLLPIAGVAYELQRAAARHPENLLVRALIAPGMLMQRLTTREPDDAQLEVALAALRKAVWRESQVAEVNLSGGSLIPLRGATTVEVFPDFDAVVRKVA